ncbi:ras-domain-containing protein [Metschnikowia bicuspidata var. bicuspidata NRRL YB-4993]|uniref:Ras-domain-containing protein n=1 Tax=Metschnikowia bicuspidata var. bicuspidata NRRL YB-4993 TaxID=869754 RepID=A0A1A0HK63_9ASCO|nr:ras-domain-containing protein [Metschnikowia bicuspidata var. bicuspidata NRRL YB-4993]OBA24277.1 ras-domain-containing protein [Metschnikowia bicuspidata var. bicuspidata NRRL YB-4993]
MSNRHSQYNSPEFNSGYFNPYEARSSPASGHGPKVEFNPSAPSYQMLDQVSKNSAYSMKIVVVGDGGCGKTCMLVSYAQQKFPEIYVPTIFENYVSTVRSPGGKRIDLALWDTAGQEEYDRLRPLSYPDTDLILICFSVDNLVSLQNVKDTWYPEVNHFCPGIPVILVGTKSDLALTIDDALPMQIAQEINAVAYIQCSAKTMTNVKEVFDYALSRFQKDCEMAEQVDRLRKRLSILRGVPGHTRNNSSASYKKGHFKNASVNSSVLLDAPLTEEPYDSNPYAASPYQQKYNEEEFAFTRKKKSRKCAIL